MKFLRIKETCLYVRDLNACRDFYNHILGLEEISFVPDKHLFFRAGDSVLLLFNPEDSKTKKSPPPHFASGNQHFAFEVPADEYETAKQQIIDKQIQIIDEVQWKSGKKSFYFRDPENNVLEILPENGIWD
jgi:catechol 2,3-dioxygenase-like lactoylglutathione lyase family enzyme